MSVYIDMAIHKWKGKLWCHLLADTVEELHIFAKQLGLKREWFQISRSGFPHYDITESKRKKAIELGAIDDPKIAWKMFKKRKDKP